MPEQLTLTVTAEDLRRICADLASELQTDMPGDYDEDDFHGILDGWREFSPRYVVLDAFDGRDVEFSDEVRKTHDETADLLERLLKHLPRKEVSRG